MRSPSQESGGASGGGVAAGAFWLFGMVVSNRDVGLSLIDRCIRKAV